MASISIRALSLLLTLISTNTFSALITIDPADFVLGTNLSHSVSGVEFSFQSDYTVGSPTVVTENLITNKEVITSEGVRTVFSDLNDNAYFNQTHAFRMDFTLPVNSVTVEFIPLDESTNASLLAFTADGLSLQGSPGSIPVLGSSPFYRSVATDFPITERAIGTVVAGMDSIGYIGKISIQTVSVDSPASLPLLFSGLMMLWGCHHPIRRHKPLFY